ncbi:N-acetylmuramic acid 6-phosphate etherase [Fuscovulum ytuae]|uniref:N-acetylmuramic acid 6-phosphate etherase n=1 Tax=Fuscovulum ytuae TaxID=3042299 RepID=A0ABY8Q3G0_9RHOB|nr:N-acetylmuramic acid 6-phosphate etherase [Fuscovulum sp. YMD61]WGV15127.1 N-acetylmuramic acid 6-phosphate etherase [Fuscovulum sp. YMD61]
MAERPTEARHPHSAGLHALPGPTALSHLLDAQLAALAAVRPAIPMIDLAATAAAGSLRAGGKLAYAGAGSSGLMALADALELAGTFGISPASTPILFAGGTAALLHMTGGVEDDPALAEADFHRAGLAQGDTILCLSASGSTPYTLALVNLARAHGLTVVGIANVAGSKLLEQSHISILLDTGPEVVNGSTRMGAATAQKVALNMLSVRLGILLGHVHDGYMVNVVADNAKLIERAARIVAGLSGRDMETAKHALSQTGGAVKPAVLMAAGSSPEQAEALLRDSDGALGPALAALNA